MFTNSLRYAKLSQQVARAIEAEILRGIWSDHLPGERYLAESMQVSRRTIRAAVEILRQKNVVKTVHGAGTAILFGQAASVDLPSLRSIGLLLPESLDHLRPHTITFIDDLRTLLYFNGFRLEIHVGQRFFSNRPAAALKKLVTQFVHDAWVLTFSTQANQAWFQARNLPALVVGMPHEGITLPHVDTDMPATCRHAASHLLRAGHRQIALVVEKSGRAGDRQTEESFLAAARDFGRAEIKASVLRHSGTVASIRQLVLRLLQFPQRPTALFISNPYHYLAVYSVLAEKGLQVPGDFSLLCRDDDLFLSFLNTEPSRYVCSAQLRAKTIFSLLMQMVKGDATKGLQDHLLPTFTEGKSVARLTPHKPSSPVDA